MLQNENQEVAKNREEPQLEKQCSYAYIMEVVDILYMVSSLCERMRSLGGRKFEESNENINPDRRALNPKIVDNCNPRIAANVQKDVTKGVQKDVQQGQKAETRKTKRNRLAKSINGMKNYPIHGQEIAFKNTNQRHQEGFQIKKDDGIVVQMMVFIIFIILTSIKQRHEERPPKELNKNTELNRTLAEIDHPHIAAGILKGVRQEKKAMAVKKSRVLENKESKRMIWIVLALLLLLICPCYKVTVETGLPEELTLRNQSSALSKAESSSIGIYSLQNLSFPLAGKAALSKDESSSMGKCSLQNESSVEQQCLSLAGKAALSKDESSSMGIFSLQNESSAIQQCLPLAGKALGVMRTCPTEGFKGMNTSCQELNNLPIVHATLPNLNKEAGKSHFLKHRISQRRGEERTSSFKTDMNLRSLKRIAFDEFIWMVVFVMLLKIAKTVGAKQRKYGCMIRTFVIISLIFIQRRECTKDACAASINSASIVKECPKNIEKWHEREPLKGCQRIHQNCTTPQKFKYHCLPNEWGNATVEVCAKVRNIVCHCAEYNHGAGIVQNNQKRPFQFPHENCSYLSNNTFLVNAKYCYDLKVEETSTSPNLITATTDTGNINDNQTHGETPNWNPTDDNSDLINVLSPIFGATFIICGIIMMCVCKKYARPKKEQPVPRIIEDEPLKPDRNLP